jgi:hypothetical protein
MLFVCLQNQIVYHICRETAMPIGVNLTSTPVTDGGLTIKLRFPLAPLKKGGTGIFSRVPILKGDARG